MHNIVARVLCTALVLSLVACGGGGGGGTTPPPPVNNLPVITEGVSTSVNISENGVLNLSLNATDPDNDTLTWIISTDAAHGTATVSNTGAVVYTPTANYFGHDGFMVQVSDGKGGTATFTVNVFVNVAPVIAQGASTSVNMSENGTPIPFKLKLDASDANNDPLTWSLGAIAAQYGTVSASGSGASLDVGYTPTTADFIGTDSFDVQVSDNHGGSATIRVNVTVTTTNTVAINVDSGIYPSDPNYYTYNRPFVSVKICDPVSTTCQTIDHIVVDTGSMGLRILTSAMSLSLPAYNDASSKPIGECYPLVGGYMWGALRTANVQIGGEVTTSPIPIQVVNDNSVATAPSGCTSKGANLGTVSAIRANGILGVGYFKQDCGAACESATNKVYYTCTTTDPTTCSSLGILAADQVLNPVTMFGLNGSGVSDNNGVIISLPAINSVGEVSVTGTLTFGVNTQGNNQLGSATALAVDNPSGLLPTTFNGKTLCNSAIDSGSNNLNFPEGTMATGYDFDTPPLCSDGTFYCPAILATDPPVPFSATIGGLNELPVAVSFGVANTDLLSSSYHAFNDVAAKLDTLAATSIPGCSGTTGSFIWGLPFFFGRDVFVVFEGETVNSSTGPFVAF